MPAGGGVKAFTIRDEQVGALAEALEADFRARLARHVEKHFPEECATLENGLEVHLAKALELARRAGIESERDLVRYASLTMICGLYFATDPERRWMQRMLSDQSISSPSERLDCLYAETVRRLEEG
jgi:hypothetical protein